MSFQYTSGDPSHLTGGANASMADIQGPFTDLRTFLNARIAAIPTLVSSLPVSPVDAQEIYYLADATNGIVWHLRYRAASASTSKWEFVGGSELLNEVTAQESTTSAAYADLTTVGPSVTVPLAGDYVVEIGARMWGDTVNNSAGMSYAIGATAAAVADGIETYTNAAATFVGPATNVGRPRVKTGLAAATVLRAKYRLTASGSAVFHNRWMRVKPVRVG